MSSPADPGWRTFVGRYHAANAGITEELLGPAVDEAGRNPYQWVADAVPAEGLVLDLACGSAPLADLVGVDRYIGLDRSPQELTLARRRRPSAQLVAGDALAPPIRARLAAVTASMAVMLLNLDELLARLAPLQPAGAVLVATVPVRGVAPTGSPYRRLLELLGLLNRPFPEPLDRDGLAPRFHLAGYTLTSDELCWFARPLRGEHDVTLVLDSFYARPGPEHGAARSHLDTLRKRDGALRYPLRRVVATRAA
ncbi:MAG: class I SAM-dependent methyltransferase [Pseudonocardiales bacterium]|nr:class I SAM-dependent methyltransferase [Pseudonocardiales bacterium]